MCLVFALDGFCSLHSCMVQDYVNGKSYSGSPQTKGKCLGEMLLIPTANIHVAYRWNIYLFYKHWRSLHPDIFQPSFSFDCKHLVNSLSFLSCTLRMPLRSPCSAYASSQWNQGPDRLNLVIGILPSLVLL